MNSIFIYLIMKILELVLQVLIEVFLGKIKYDKILRRQCFGKTKHIFTAALGICWNLLCFEYLYMLFGKLLNIVVSEQSSYTHFTRAKIQGNTSAAVSKWVTNKFSLKMSLLKITINKVRNHWDNRILNANEYIASSLGIFLAISHTQSLKKVRLQYTEL